MDCVWYDFVSGTTASDRIVFDVTDTAAFDRTVSDMNTFDIIVPDTITSDNTVSGRPTTVF